MKLFKSLARCSRPTAWLFGLFLLLVAASCGGGGGESGENREVSREHHDKAGCDLQIEKSLRGDRLTPGGSGVFVLEITNVGDRPCRGNLEVEDLLPPGIHFASALSSPGWTCSGDGQDPETVDCSNTGTTLGPGASTTLYLQVDVGESAACTLGNTAAVSISGRRPGGVQPGPPIAVPGPPLDPPGNGFGLGPRGFSDTLRSASRHHGGRPDFHLDTDLSNNTDHIDFEVESKLDCINPPSGMVGWWSADLNAQDISGLGNNGTTVDDATYNSGYVQHSFDFDNSDDTSPAGESDHVVVPDSSSLNFGKNSFSVDAWVRPTERKEIHPIVFKTGVSADGNAAGYAFWVQGDELNLSIRGGGASDQVSGGIVPLGEWSHVTGVVDRANGDMRIYVNGGQVASSGISAGSTDNGERLFIGRTGAGNWIFDRPLFFQGQVDEVELFRKTLTNTEIAQLFRARTCGKCKDPDEPGFKCADDPEAVEPPADMVSWWTLDETAGTTAFDYQGANDGTHFNAPTPTPAGRVDGALEFNSLPEFVIVADDSTLDFNAGSYTMDAWIFHGTAQDIYPIADKWHNPPAGFDGYLLHSNVFGDITFRAGDGTTDITTATTTGPATPGNWNHIASVWDRSNSQARIFVNGALEASQPIPSNLGPVTNNQPLIFADSYVGTLDEIEFFDRALSQAEIQSIVDAADHGKCKDGLNSPPSDDRP